MYVLECADGSLYTGYTTDVEKRLKTHTKYTRARLLLNFYQESYPDKPLCYASAECSLKRNPATKATILAKPSDS